MVYACPYVIQWWRHHWSSRWPTLQSVTTHTVGAAVRAPATRDRWWGRLDPVTTALEFCSNQVIYQVTVHKMSTPTCWCFKCPWFIVVQQNYYNDYVHSINLLSLFYNISYNAHSSNVNFYTGNITLIWLFIPLWYYIAIFVLLCC